MKRYFDVHDRRMTAELTLIDGSRACCASAKEFEHYFGSKDVREIDFLEYERLSTKCQLTHHLQKWGLEGA